MNEEIILKNAAVFAPIEHHDWQQALQALSAHLDGAELETALQLEAHARQQYLRAWELVCHSCHCDPRFALTW
jgi:hypothetical protein